MAECPWSTALSTGAPTDSWVGHLPSLPLKPAGCIPQVLLCSGAFVQFWTTGKVLFAAVLRGLVQCLDDRKLVALSFVNHGSAVEPICCYPDDVSAGCDVVYESCPDDLSIPSDLHYNTDQQVPGPDRIWLPWVSCVLPGESRNFMWSKTVIREICACHSRDPFKGAGTGCVDDQNRGQGSYPGEESTRVYWLQGRPGFCQAAPAVDRVRLGQGCLPRFVAFLPVLRRFDGLLPCVPIHRAGVQRK